MIPDKITFAHQEAAKARGWRPPHAEHTMERGEVASTDACAWVIESDDDSRYAAWREIDNLDSLVGFMHRQWGGRGEPTAEELEALA